jgi:ATP-dependent Clp protease ATP-binding subunit ClpC
MEGSAVFERFTDRSRRVLVLAQEEARQLNHSFIGSEHLLLGLIQEREGVAAKALATLDITLGAARERVAEAIGSTGAAPSGTPPFTPRAKKILELALREALQLGHSYIGTEHILLGLVREGDGVAAQVIVSLGVDLGLVRQRVVQLITGSQGASEEELSSHASHYSRPRTEDDLLLRLLWNARMIRKPRSAAERTIWDAMKERFETQADDDS